MNKPDLRDPNNNIYVICTIIALAVTTIFTVASLVYFAVYAPSNLHELNEGPEATTVEGFLICLAVFLVCFYLLIRDFVKRMKGCPSEERDARFMRAPLSKAAVLTAITVLTSLVFVAISWLIGAAMSESFLSRMTNYQLLASMLVAGPLEEGLFRILPIGVPMFIICLVYHKGSAKDILGGFGMSRAALVLIFISAVIFGIAHLDGWSIMKFPDTFISGILFGYAYVQYGAHTTIFMHSAFDMMVSYDIFYDGLGTVLMIVLAVLGVILLVRSLIDYRKYLPGNNLHEPYEGGLLEMWEKD